MQVFKTPCVTTFVFKRTTHCTVLIVLSGIQGVLSATHGFFLLPTCLLFFHCFCAYFSLTSSGQFRGNAPARTTSVAVHTWRCAVLSEREKRTSWGLALGLRASTSSWGRGGWQLSSAHVQRPGNQGRVSSFPAAAQEADPGPVPAEAGEAAVLMSSSRRREGPGSESALKSPPS